MKFIYTLLGCILFSPFKIWGQISVQSTADTTGVNQVYELTISHPHNYPNNWEDVDIQVKFTNAEQTMTISGFYYNSYTWKVRFSPPATGKWNYFLQFTSPASQYNANGTFTCIASDEKGFLKQHPNNPFRLIYPDGTAFNGLGIEDCVLDYNGNGTPLDDWGFDGDFRTGNYTGSRTDLHTYMDAYGVNGAGFNLFRWTTDNCSFRLYDSITTHGNGYSIKNGIFGDTLVTELKRQKMCVWLTFFGPPVFNDISAGTIDKTEAIKRYIKYVIARYGAYTDIWELFNESSASDYYYQAICAYIKSIDPYQRLISVSDERPQLPEININSPHWYEKESELESDSRAWQMITSQKKYNKPIMFGEQGNSVQCWDPLSATRMRLRTWTAFFAEGTLIFWNASWAKDYQHAVAANIYLGPEERSYIKSLHDFLTDADSSYVPFKLTPDNSDEVRAYASGGKSGTLAYFHHFTSHNSSVNSTFQYRMRRPGMISWIDPSTNVVIKNEYLKYGTQTIASPSFKIDMAMKIKYDNSSFAYNEAEPLDALVYPNPAEKEILINGNFNAAAVIKIYTIKGKIALPATVIRNDERISIATLASGLYIYVITSNGRSKNGKLYVK